MVCVFGYPCQVLLPGVKLATHRYAPVDCVQNRWQAKGAVNAHKSCSSDDESTEAFGRKVGAGQMIRRHTPREPQRSAPLGSLRSVRSRASFGRVVEPSRLRTTSKGQRRIRPNDAPRFALE